MEKQIRTERGIITIDFIDRIPADARYAFTVHEPEEHDIYSISTDIYHHSFFTLA